MIIINHMFTGNYLNDNIGHEIINLFKADDNENYIYLCKDGEYTKKDMPEYIIQVRRPHNTTRTLEIINIAKGIEYTEKKEKEIQYGGIPVNRIFCYNESQQNKNITFKAKSVIKPSSPLYIYYQGKKQDYEKKDNEIVLSEKKNGKYKFNVSQQLREYLLEGEDYEKLKKLCDDFFSNNQNNKELEIIKSTQDTKSTYIITPADIYGIGTWELAYSNAFKYFMDKHESFLKEFCNLCLMKYDTKYSPITNIKKHKIYREFNHIDLLIEVNDYVFVIENKIFSDINGKDKKQPEYNENKSNNYIDKFNDQLKKYYNFIEKETEIEKNPFAGNQYKKIYILLTPNHNKINLLDENWKTVYYKDIINICTEEKDEDFNKFISMIKLHAEDDYNYGIMKRKFEIALLNAEKELKSK